METFKQALTDWRIIILIVVMAMFIAAIRPNPFVEGVVINSIAKNSSAQLAGIASPSPKLPPMARERILSVDDVPTPDLAAYHKIVSELRGNQTIVVQTTKGSYRLLTKPKLNIISLNETVVRIVEVVEEVNESINGTIFQVNRTFNKTIELPVEMHEIVGMEDLGFRVGEAPATNLRKGLDLQGGTRVVLKPVEPVSDDTLGLMIASLNERLNVYGLSDLSIKPVREPGVLGGGGSYILIEIAGATEDEVRGLLARQGKFEATIANQTVFRGGQDVTYVCRTADCSGIDPGRPCGAVQGGYQCGFLFEIALSPEAAQRQADITKSLAVVTEGGSRHLTDDLVLFLDDQEVDRLRIDASLRGRASTRIAITGSGFGVTVDEAATNTLQNMKRLQTVLISGSLPVKLDVVKIDTISPILGASFVRNAVLVGLIALAGVLVLLMLYYRSLRIAIPISITSIAEVLSVLGTYALFGWTLDLAAIAGIIVAVGTGVNDQIIITDEVLRKSGEVMLNWKERVKRAFGMIFSVFATLVVAMVPLLFAGAGLLRGFAITTIVGVTIGVLVTRPAYAAIVHKLIGE